MWSGSIYDTASETDTQRANEARSPLCSSSLPPSLPPFLKRTFLGLWVGKLQVEVQALVQPLLCHDGRLEGGEGGREGGEGGEARQVGLAICIVLNNCILIPVSRQVTSRW